MTRQDRLSVVVFLLLSIQWLIPAETISQDSPFSKHRISLLGGTSDFIKVSYDYSWLGGVYTFRKSFKQEGKVFYFLQPGMLVSRYLPSPDSEIKNSGFEVGLNLGLGYHYRSWNIELGSGPYYMGADIDRQIRGFLFNNQLFLRYEQDRWGFSVGFRHISNGEIRLPNGGINSFMIGADYLWH